MLMRKHRRAKRKASAAAGMNPAAGMWLTFRAELMPGRETRERTFRVTQVLANGRVELADLEGQHAVAEFQPLDASNVPVNGR